MAYSPIEQGRLLDDPVLRRVAERHNATPAQVAIAWVLRVEGVCTIPKAGTLAHVWQNREALDIRLTDEDLGALESAFPTATGPRSLEML
jgi:diketogulonate reductase-like aldo/keto reductase